MPKPPADEMQRFWLNGQKQYEADSDETHHLSRHQRNRRVVCGNGDGLDRVKRADAEWRAGPALAVEAMTGDDQFRWFCKRQSERAATASGIGHWKNSVF